MSKKWMRSAALVAVVAATMGSGAITARATATTEPDDARAPLLVPEEYSTIQDAVTAAVPGDLILVSPGTYHEAVNVVTDQVTIRGLDRNDVVLDGEFELDNGIRVLGAQGVVIENMTATNYTANGFFWTGVDGYRGSYLTTYRTGDYGIYAFDSTHGLIEHSYTVGSPDAGLYIGQCYPCDAVVDHVVSEHNGLGYSGTNSGGNLVIVNSTFRYNRAGLVPNSGSYELCYPERETTIIGNLVYSNNQPDTPAIDVAILAMGNGILPAGGIRNVIRNNRVFDHDKTGIGLVPFLEDVANDDIPPPEEWDRPCADAVNDPVNANPPDSLLWNSMENEVTGNVLEDNRTADLAVASVDADISTLGNCFADNTFTLSAPVDLEALAPCDGDGSGDWTDGTLDVAQWLVEKDSRPPAVDYAEADLPPLEPQENMPDASVPAQPAINMPPVVDVDAIGVPDAPDA